MSGYEDKLNNTNITSIETTTNDNKVTDEKSEITNSIENKIFVDEKIESIDSQIWMLEIPKIKVAASISEGTSSEVLNEFIGHFEDTQKFNGNIGLAAHNRGYDVNYFGKLKDLDLGDEVFYTYNGIRNRYIINSKTIINDTDWSKLENTKENLLTLITCVENKPHLRRCVQAIKI